MPDAVSNKGDENPAPEPESEPVLELGEQRIKIVSTEYFTSSPFFSALKELSHAGHVGAKVAQTFCLHYPFF